MTARTATKSGNWSDVTVWDGGTTLPGSGDTANSNGYTVTIDQNVDLSPSGSLINTNAGAGGFSVTAAKTITANVIATVRTVLTCSHALPSVVTITGNATGGTGGTGIINSSTGTINMTGISTGGSANTYLNGIQNFSTGTVNITGSAVGGSGSVGAENYGNGTMTITGNATGGNGNNSAGARNDGTGTLTIAGNAIGGGGTNDIGAFNNGNGTLIVSGIVIGSLNSAGLHGTGSTANTRASRFQSHSSGRVPITGFVKIIPSATVNYFEMIRSDTGAALQLSNDYPATADVKSGVTYKLGTQLGTLAGGAVSISPIRGNL